METFAGAAKTLHPNLIGAVHRYRHKVFVDRLGWDLPRARNGLEIDQFDRPDTVHVGLHEMGKLKGYARLLPTTLPYLLGDIFPELMDGAPAPSSPEIWEISRFCAVDLEDRDAVPQFDLWVGREVLAACVRQAIERRIGSFITVSPVGIERLLRKVGATSRRAGPPMRLNGHSLYACWIEIDDRTLEALDAKMAHEVA